MTVRFSVTVRQVREDGSEAPLDGELAAALAAPAEQFAGLAAWAAEESRYLDHGEREKAIGTRRVASCSGGCCRPRSTIDSAREERAEGVTSAAGIGHGTVEAGHGRGVTSVFGPVRVSRLAYRNRREPNLYPADARQVLPDDPYSLGMRALAAFHLAGGRVRAGPGGHRGPHRRHRRPRPAHRPRGRPRRLDGRLLRGTLPRRGRRRAAGQRRDHDAGRRQGHRHAPGAPQERREGGRHAPRDQEDGRDRRRRRLHPRRPGTGGHRRPARPPPGRTPARKPATSGYRPRSPSPSRT